MYDMLRHRYLAAVELAQETISEIAEGSRRAVRTVHSYRAGDREVTAGAARELAAYLRRRALDLQDAAASLEEATVMKLGTLMQPLEITLRELAGRDGRVTFLGWKLAEDRHESMGGLEVAVFATVGYEMLVCSRPGTDFSVPENVGTPMEPVIDPHEFANSYEWILRSTRKDVMSDSNRLRNAIDDRWGSGWITDGVLERARSILPALPEYPDATWHEFAGLADEEAAAVRTAAGVRSATDSQDRR